MPIHHVKLPFVVIKGPGESHLLHYDLGVNVIASAPEVMLWSKLMEARRVVERLHDQIVATGLPCTCEEKIDYACPRHEAKKFLREFSLASNEPRQQSSRRSSSHSDSSPPSGSSSSVEQSSS